MVSGEAENNKIMVIGYREFGLYCLTPLATILFHLNCKKEGLLFTCISKINLKKCPFNLNVDRFQRTGI